MISSEHLLRFQCELETEKNVLSAFVDTLKKEEQALIDGKITDIDRLTSEKSRLIEKLIQLDNKRNQFLIQQGLSLNKHNVEAWMAEQYAAQPSLKTLWNELLSLAKTIQQLTHSNGLIIANRLQHNQRAFAALHCAAGNVALYGPQGQTYL